MPKILCLHGFVQNGPLFARKASGVRKALAKIGYETVFLTAPITVAHSDLPFESTAQFQGAEGRDEMRSWWYNSESDPNYYRFDESLEAIKECVATQGPFEGVLGFSQGGGLAGILCTDEARKLFPELGTTLKFGVFYSGFRAKVDFQQHWYSTPITIPTLHFKGSLDTVVSEDRVMWLYNSCDPSTRTMVVHPGGHFVPNAKDMINCVVDWVKHLGEQPKEEEPKKESDWSEFDAIGAA